LLGFHPAHSTGSWDAARTAASSEFVSAGLDPNRSADLRSSGHRSASGRLMTGLLRKINSLREIS